MGSGYYFKVVREIIMSKNDYTYGFDFDKPPAWMRKTGRSNEDTSFGTESEKSILVLRLRRYAGGLRKTAMALANALAKLETAPPPDFSTETPQSVSTATDSYRH